MVKSKGKRSKTRKKLRKNIREKGKLSINRIIQDFPPGSKACIRIDPSVHSGQPHPKYHGETGTILGKQGKAYVVEIKNQNKTKSVIVRPEHLQKVEG